MSGAPAHELKVDRHIDAPREVVWRVLTERMAEWFAPKPWTTRIIEADLRAGGRSALEMTGPNGETSGSDGIYLEVVPGERLVFTDAFKAGWLPQPNPFMVGFFELADDGTGTRYTGRARHWTAEAMRQHEAMGFTTGWGQVAAQLAALAEEEARR